MTILSLSSPVAAGPGTTNWHLTPQGYLGHGLGHKTLIPAPDGYHPTRVEYNIPNTGLRHFDLTPSVLVRQGSNLSLVTAPEVDELIMLITLRSEYSVYNLSAHGAEVLLRNPMNSSKVCHLAVRLTHPNGYIVAQAGNTAEIYSWHGRTTTPIASLGLHRSDIIEDHRAASQLAIARELNYLRDFCAAIAA